jgi:mannitol/fructose-specific phosphotransferase system IIA component (Ntr-type)
MRKATQTVHLEEENRQCTFVVGTDVPAADWEQAVRVTGAMLVEAGAAEERYIDAMIDVVKELGPYIVLAPGVAMPHAGCDKGALDVAVAVARLATPVEFGSKHNDPVRTVIGFCTPEPDGHISMLRRIALVLGNNESLESLHGATSCEEVSALFANAA